MGEYGVENKYNYSRQWKGFVRGAGMHVCPSAVVDDGCVLSHQDFWMFIIYS